VTERHLPGEAGEEIEAEGDQRVATSTPCSEELAGTASRALVYLTGSNDAAERVWVAVAELAGGRMPTLGAQAIVLCARALRDRTGADGRYVEG
jgi:hypothetical protein